MPILGSTHTSNEIQQNRHGYRNTFAWLVDLNRRPGVETCTDEPGIVTRCRLLRA